MTSKASSQPVAATRFRRKPLITALEPRLLLDGAAVATTVDMTTDVAYQEQTEQSAPAPETTTPTAAAPAESTLPATTPTASDEPVPVDTPEAPTDPVVADGAEPDAEESDTTSGTAQTEAVETEAAATSTTPDSESATSDQTDALAGGMAPTTPRRETAFVDTQVQDYQTLVDGLDDTVEVHLIDASSNGLEQIAQVLQGQTGIDAIHIYSHGDVGQVTLGSLTLGVDNLGQYSDLLSQIGQSLSADADLLLYGCYVGADSEGLDFIEGMAQLTGADVAASNDLTGASEQGGDWVLEVSSGSVETAALSQRDFVGLLATPSISNLSDFTYTEDSGAVTIDQTITISGASDFRGGYIEFAVTGATSFETLGINRLTNADITAGVISVVGSTVYRGTGSAAEVIGSVDSTYNGQNGQPLRFNLSNAFQNGSFEAGTAGSTVITGWTVQNGRIRLDGSYQIAGQATPVDSTYSAGNTTGDYSTGGSFTQSAVLANDGTDLALELDTGASSIGEPYGVIRGPAVYSNGTVSLVAGDQVSFNWKALSGGDAYDAYGYIIDVNTGQTITILNETGTSTNQESAWANRVVTIGAGQAGVYRFVFVAGSFDLSGGQYLGGKLMIDDVTVTQANPPGALSGADVSSLSSLVTYSNTDPDFANTTRTLTVTAKDGTADPAGSSSATITLVRSNDAPSFTSGAGLGAVNEDTTNPSGASVSSLFGGRFSDPDAANTPADTLAGIAVVADASSASQGTWEYSTDGTNWYGIGSVSNSSALVLSSSTLVRFKPVADWNGTPGSLSVHAVDSTYAGGYASGATRATYDTTTDGSTSPVSASAVSLSTSITSVNDAPVATDDSGSAIEAGGVANATAGTSASGTLLTNDTDVESDPLVVSAIRTGTASGSGTSGTVGVALAGAYGSLTVAANGSYTYTVNQNNAAVQALRLSGQALTDSFAYTVRDTGGLTDVATLTITIDGRNDNPVGVDDAATAVERGGVSNGTLGANATGNVLSNDTDVDSVANGETKTVTTVRTGAEAGSGTAGTVGTSLTGTYGSLTLNSDGSFTYVIDESNVAVQALRVTGQTLSESFAYTVTDTGGLTDVATLTITIDGRNDNPVGVDDAATALEASNRFNGTAGADATGNVLSNDTDVDSVANGETITVSAVRTGGESGSGFSGTVGQALVGTYGSLTLNADGSYAYVIDDSNAAVQALRVSGQTLVESFTYTVQDTGGLTDQATLTITIDGRNDNPVANDDAGTAIEAGGVFNGTAGANATGNVLANDTDVDSVAGGETKTVTALRTGAEGGGGRDGVVGQALAGTYGRITINADGSYTYVVDDNNPTVQALRVAGQTLTESFTYTVTDAGSLTDIATLTITIEGRNDAPVAESFNVPDQIWPFGKAYRLDISAPFTDVDSAANGEAFNFSISGLPSGLSYDPNTGVISGSPSGIGTFTVVITASDREGASISRQFVLEILPPAQQDSPQAPLPPVAPAPTDGGTSGLGTPTDNTFVNGDTNPFPTGTITTDFGGNIGNDVGYLSGESAFTDQGATPPSNQNTSGDGVQGAAGPAPEQPSGSDANATERLVLAEGETRVTEYVNPEGKVTSVRATVQVDVGANGQVVFSDAQKQAFDIVGLSISSIVGEQGAVSVKIADQARGTDTQFYAGELGNGESLPSWIRVNQNTGEITVSNPPADVTDVTVRVKAIGSDGKVRILEVELELDKLLKRVSMEDSEPTVRDTVKGVAFVPLSEQVTAQLVDHDHYGDRLMAMLELA